MMLRLCDMIDISCKECPFGFLDADAGCPLYYSEDAANVDITEIAMKCGDALKKLTKSE